MPYQNFLISNLKSGIQTNKKPFLIADDAYELLRNVYVWRDRLKKRFGARVMDQTQTMALLEQFTRLRIKVDTTNFAGFSTGTVPEMMDPTRFGQMFSIGPVYFTVNALGNPVTMLSTTAAIGEFDTTTGAYTFIGAPGLTDVYYYPALPVMHIGLYQQLAVNEKTIAFDTQFSYEYTQGLGWQRSGGVPGKWNSSNSDFHWTTNYRGVLASTYLLFVVNNIVGDGIQYYDGTDWNLMPPPVTNAAGDTINTALIVTVFKNRMLLFNVTETVNNVVTVFKNRIRFSKTGSPLDANSWLSDNTSVGGGFINAPTQESIISVQPLKDRVIVFFESSTYELVFTSNNADPFNLQKINTELGVESTHSTIPFDKVVVGMGSTGTHACNGLNVERIDQDIPDNVFDIVNENNGPLRVHGIRDYYEELVYWTYPSDTAAYRNSNIFPNRLLVMDYIKGTWAIFDDSITTFGYFFLQNNYLIWQNIDESWQNMALPWNYGIGFNLFRSVLAGNQQGWTFVISEDIVRNCMSLQITDIIVNPASINLIVLNHNVNLLSPFMFINYIQATGAGQTLTTLNGTIQELVYVDNNTLQINLAGMVGVYSGGGTLERVSQIEILTKQYNFFPETGERCYLPYVDFYVDRTPSGQITVDYLSSTSTLSTVTQAQVSGAIFGNNILETSPYPTKPWEMTQTQFWHRIYLQQDGEVVQLRLYMTTPQMLDLSSVNNNFVINAVQYYAQPTSTYI